ncbi:MAG: hypothetical protein M1269_12570, partial [Chloroflexi bacterium]|nr:hypothetical protein [Chloroflexota bacterium]
MCVARLLAKMEQENATFATKADLEELQKLVNSLKDELAALGVRVGNLEDSVGKLDKRVTDLERIRFYGSLDTAYVSNGFKATGNNQGQSTSFYAANLMDGRTYFVGTGFTMKGIFGVRAKVSDELSAGLELAAYVSNGDDYVNDIYGISAPYMNNFFTQRTYVSADSNTAMTPWTRVNLDNFWLKHNPSGLKLVVGSYDSMFSSVMYASPVNPNVNGPKFLGSYGFQVTGNTRLFSPMDYEVMYTYLPDGNKDLAAVPTPSVPGTVAYDSKAMGFNLKWNFDKGMIKIGFLRALNERRNGSVSSDVYNIYDQNGLFTPIMHWVNPAEYNCLIAANNLDPNKQPVSMTAASLANAAGMSFVGTGGLGTEYFRVGPQGLYNLGLSGDYNFDPIRFSVDLASSTFRPNTNSDYKKNGTSMKIGLGAALMGGQLDLALDYLSTSPYYNPMIFQYPYISDTSKPTTFPNNNIYYFRLPAFSYFPNLWQLSDSEVYPNNREGFRFKADYKFAG